MAVPETGAVRSTGETRTEVEGRALAGAREPAPRRSRAGNPVGTTGPGIHAHAGSGGYASSPPKAKDEGRDPRAGGGAE